MKPALLEALGRSRADYTEIRFRRVWSTQVLVRGRAVEDASSGADRGGFVRCWSAGSGFGQVGFTGADRIGAAVLLAHELSLASASRVPVSLAPIAVRELETDPTLPDDPREIPLAEKRQRTESLADLLAGIDRRVSASRVLCRDQVVETWLATSEGTWIHELRSEVSASALAVAVEEGNLERAVGSVGARGGWKALSAAEPMAASVATRAVERLHATPVRPGRYTLVLDGGAAGALIHRAVAHLARPGLPGADPDVLPLGTRVGPECLTVGDDPTAEGLRAGGAVDDEGTTARRTLLIQHGVVVGHLHSRETAASSRQAPTGHARAGSLRAPPFPRASNSFLAQGQGTLEDLLGDIPLGIYLSDSLSAESSGDRLAFRAGSARMIRQGRLAEPVKGVQLSEALLSLLGRVEGVGGDFAWDTSAACCRDGGAGMVPVTTGAPHLRLVDVPVGEGIS